MKTLGFIGTGGMGSGMAANLIKAGYSLVVNDLRRQQTRALESQGGSVQGIASSGCGVMRNGTFDATVQRGRSHRWTGRRRVA